MPKTKKSINHFKDFLIIAAVATAILIAVFTAARSSLIATLNQPRAADVFSSYAIFSDSSSDEYRADDNRGGSYGATTLNWVEQLNRYRDLSFGTYGNWGGYRRTGFQYNFSRSGATTGSALSAGAHRDLGAMVQAGTVRFVFYNLGANDFAWYNSQFGQIYTGQLAGAALDAYTSGVVANITTAVDTINASGKAKMLVALVPDGTISPAARTNFPDPVKLQRVSDAVKKTNDGVRAMVKARGYALYDTDAVAQKLLGLVNAQGNATIGGEVFSFTIPGDEPHHIMLADNIHAGTVFEGIFANEWIDAVNGAFGTQIVPFSDDELLMHAGLRAASPLPTVKPTSVPTVAPTATPFPSVVPTARPTMTPQPTIRPTSTPLATVMVTPRPTVTPTKLPTASPRASVSPTPKPTAIPVPVDPLVKYCGTYKAYRFFVLRFLTPTQVREWDVRCAI